MGKNHSSFIYTLILRIGISSSQSEPTSQCEEEVIIDTHYYENIC